MNIIDSIKWRRFMKWQKKIHRAPRWKGDDFRSDYGNRGIFELLSYLEKWCTTQGMYFARFSFPHYKLYAHELWTLRKKIRDLNNLEDKLEREFEEKVSELVGPNELKSLFVKGNGHSFLEFYYANIDEAKVRKYFEAHKVEILKYYAENPTQLLRAKGIRTQKWQMVTDVYSQRAANPESVKLVSSYTPLFKSLTKNGEDPYDLGKRSGNLKQSYIIFVGEDNLFNPELTCHDVISYVRHISLEERFNKEVKLRPQLFSEIFTYFYDKVIDEQGYEHCRALMWDD